MHGATNGPARSSLEEPGATFAVPIASNLALDHAPHIAFSGAVFPVPLDSVRMGVRLRQLGLAMAELALSHVAREPVAPS
jgi:hypothetical protein